MPRRSEQQVKSEVARELWKGLERTKVFRGRPQKFLADQLSVNETVFSKRLKALKAGETPHDDKWIMGLGRLIDLDKRHVQKLIIRAHIERSSTDEQLREMWEGVLEGLFRPHATISRALSDLHLLHLCLNDLGIDIPLKTLRNFLQEHFPRQRIIDLSIPKLSLLRTGMKRLVFGDDSMAIFPSVGEISGKLNSLINIRKIRPTDDMVESAFVARLNLKRGRGWSLPLIPGLLGYLVEFDKGGESPPHCHEGIEVVIALRGSFCIVFEGHGDYELSAQTHDLIIYNSGIQHHVRSAEPSTLLIVHWDSSLIRRWDKVLRIHFPEESNLKCGTDRSQEENHTA